MQNKIKSFINSSIAMSVAFIALGVLFIIFPQESLDVLRWIIAIFFMAAGVGMLASDLTSRRMPFFGSTALGTIMLIAGILFAVNPGVMDIFPIILGAWFIVSSVSTLRLAASLSSAASAWAVISAIISILAGIVLIINPWGGSMAMTIFAGVMMLVYAAASLVDLITIRRHFNDLTKAFKQIAEGEVVETKKSKK